VTLRIVGATNVDIRRPDQRKNQRFVPLWPAAFEKTHLDARVDRTQGQTQRGGRRVAGGSEGPQQEEQGLTCLGRQVKPAEALGPYVIGPEEQRASSELSRRTRSN
jgi:hypothetical protein